MFIQHYVSCVTCKKIAWKKNPLKKLTKWWSWSVEGLLSTGPTPSSFQQPCRSLAVWGKCLLPGFPPGDTHKVVMLPRHSNYSGSGENNYKLDKSFILLYSKISRMPLKIINFGSHSYLPWILNQDLPPTNVSALQKKLCAIFWFFFNC